MNDQKKSAQLRYLEELALSLRREGFRAVQPEGGEMLHVILGVQEQIEYCLPDIGERIREQVREQTI